jgi:AraC-like DNA-binding protein
MVLPPGLSAAIEHHGPRPLCYYFVFFEWPALVAWPADQVPPDPRGSGPVRSNFFRDYFPCLLRGPFFPEWGMLFRWIQLELEEDRLECKEVARAYLSVLAIAFWRRFLGQGREGLGRGAPKGWKAPALSGQGLTVLPEPLIRATEYMAHHLEKDFSLREVARQSGYSVRRLVQLFRKHLGPSPMAYLRDLRIAEARKLLSQPNLSVKEVAARLNFSSAQHFSKVFRDKTGVSPSQFATGIHPEIPPEGSRKKKALALGAQG